jgi:tripartite-type tricarboxylate transporter receptor subunit TctC
MAPAGTPKEVVATLSDAFQQALANPDLRRAMTVQGADPAFLNSEQFGAYLVAQLPVWAKAVKDSGAKLD